VADELAWELMGQGLDEQAEVIAEGPRECGVRCRDAVEDELELKLVTTRRAASIAFHAE